VYCCCGCINIVDVAAAATDEMFVLASEELSTMTDMEELEQGR
jgi:hypothetical protein